jgi:hypothetical protein
VPQPHAITSAQPLHKEQETHTSCTKCTEVTVAQKGSRHLHANAKVQGTPGNGLEATAIAHLTTAHYLKPRDPCYSWHKNIDAGGPHAARLERTHRFGAPRYEFEVERPPANRNPSTIIIESVLNAIVLGPYRA